LDPYIALLTKDQVWGDGYVGGMYGKMSATFVVLILEPCRR